MPPRDSTKVSARCQTFSGMRRPSLLDLILEPKVLPMKKPKDSPAKEPSITATNKPKKSNQPLTMVPAAKTTVSPGTKSPINTLVSSRMAKPAMMSRQNGGKVWTAVFSQSMN